MPGPLPKNPQIRQRTNKKSTRAILPAEDAPIERRPRLPNHPLGDGWHPMAVRWWNEVFASPVRYELIRADLGALFRLVTLVDRYWRDQSLAVAREIRLMEREFGLTPLSRRRLEWSVAQAEEAKDRHQVNRARRARVIGGNDPREVLE
jgi:hypothetical protein